MSGGYRVDPDELTRFADRLADTGDELRAVASALAERVGDLGPQGVPEAVSALLAQWADAVRGWDLPAAADAVRAAAGTYRRADELPGG
ncbi:hypothetical protein GCM10009660_48970 [Catellatospora bangladeshensis]